jgi:hypothetical protein
MQRPTGGSQGKEGLGRLNFVLCVVIVAMCAGCTTTQKEYEGPALPDSAVAVVEVGATQLFDGTVPLGVEEIDSTEHAGTLSYDQFVPLSTQEFRLLPGTHAFVFDLQPTKGLLNLFHHNQRFEVSATLEGNKRYRFIGRRDPLTIGTVAGAVVEGDIPVHIEMLDETDGSTIRFNQETHLSQEHLPLLIGPQTVAAYPEDLSTMLRSGAAEPPPPLPPPQPLMTYGRWLKENQEATPQN